MDQLPPVRHAWVDAGRGVAIVLVVLVHARDWLATAGLDLTVWDQVNDVLSGLRMPLFFAVSGLLGARWVTARWPSLLAQKVTFLFWAYLLWQPIGLLAALLADQITGAHQTPLHFLVSLAATTVRPRSELWFLWSLAVYFVLARLTARTPVWAQLLMAGAVSAVCLSALVPEENLGWSGVPKFYVFFLLGAHHRQLVLWFAERSGRSWWLAGGVVVGWAVTATVSLLSGAERLVGPGLLTRLLGLAAGVVLATLLARSRLIRYLGAQTLPIYLAHTPIIIVLAWAVHRTIDAPWVQTLTPILPIAVTVAVVPLTLALHALLNATPARVLYAPPQRVTELVQRLCDPPSLRRDSTPDSADSRAAAQPEPEKRDHAA